MTPRAGNRGFTLLELLISLTLLGGIGIVMFGGLWYGIQTWHRTTVFAERADDITVMRQSLTQLLGHAYPLYIPPPPAPHGAAAAPHGSQSGIAFTGTARRIAFLAPTPQSLGGGGLTRFQLDVEPDPVGMSLVMRAQPELTNDPNGWVASTIVEHAKEIVFSYYDGNVAGDRSSKWLKHWEHRPMLPKMIRIGVAFPGFNWPDVTIAPRVAVDVGCAYDPATMACSGR